jgi:hypothetical protein
MDKREGELQLHELFRRPADRKTDGTWYIDFTANYPFGDSGFTLLTYGILDVKHDGSGNSKVAYDDWRIGLSYVVPDGLFKSLEIGAYYTGNTANEGFYTDLTGYNTAKDAGIVYIKKTF